MSRLSEYTRRIEEYETAEETAGALQDVNALRMEAIRRRFEKNRAFFDEIRALYRIVHAGARRAAPPAPHAERVLYVAVTSNRRFAGTLTRDTIDVLGRELAAHPAASCFVIGRVGWQYFDAAGYRARGRQIVFAGDTPTREEFKALLRHAARFERVFVLYARFINAFRQEVAMEDITQSPEKDAPSAASAETAETYLFEPEVSALFAFFDAQARYLLLERVLLESDLARTAARFATMEEARERAEALVRVERGRRMREMAAESNAALLETFAGYGHWHEL